MNKVNVRCRWEILNVFTKMYANRIFLNIAHVKFYNFLICVSKFCSVKLSPTIEPHTTKLRMNNMQRTSAVDVVRRPAGHRPMLSFTDAGRRPYDL